ncbi:MAG: methionine synthase [Rhodospirillaceae bacterium]|nr:methionine synthase [Rhodospirillaceae bacterium]
MLRSLDRIRVTHVGSLPRPRKLIEAMIAEDLGKKVPEKEYDEILYDAVKSIVAKQVALGIDCVDDGEFSKRGFAVYAHARLGGLSPTGYKRPSPWANSRESNEFPEFYGPITQDNGSKPTHSTMQMACTQKLTYKGKDLLKRDLDNLAAALAESEVEEAFVPAISPCDIAGNVLNEHYQNDEEFLMAIADAMNVEYRAIVDAGFLLQIDDPRLINYYVKNPDKSIEECRAWAQKQVESINYALKGISPDRVRYHTCYGINMGPRVHDMEMKDIIDIILNINADGLSFEAANPRHEHEWKLWENINLPEQKTLIPGVITHSSVLVEHPELVAERLMRYASVVGKENVMAGGDCGFGTQAMAEPEIHPTIVWAKFSAMVEGARIASAKLWS